MPGRKALLLAACATGLLGAGLAHVQTGAIHDPAQLPEIKGVVAQYDLTPRGDVDGLILQDGTEVHMPPHLSAELAAAVRPGGAVTIHGLRARALPLVQAASITDDASGRTVTDTGPRGGPGAHPPGPPPPHGPRDEGQALDAQGTVKMLLHGPRGDFNGVLLDSGAMIHLPPPEAARLAADLAVGRTVAASGFGVQNTLGESIAARRIGASRDTMAQVAAPPPGGPRSRPPGPPPAPGAGPDADPQATADQLTGGPGQQPHGAMAAPGAPAVPPSVPEPVARLEQGRWTMPAAVESDRRNRQLRTLPPLPIPTAQVDCRNLRTASQDPPKARPLKTGSSS
jgi:hypothetical protein